MYGIELLIYSQTSNSAEVWELISKSIPHFTGHVITHPCSDESWTILAQAGAKVNIADYNGTLYA